MFLFYLHTSCKIVVACRKIIYRSEGNAYSDRMEWSTKDTYQKRGPIGTANSDCLNNREGSFYLRGEMRRSTRLQYRDVSFQEEAANCLTPPQRLFIVFLAATIINQE
ncbi:hypothetical protein TNIN_140321 [Trichonephila inaurata madagascariensis]|uniref:Uncharacterized protein n=1 Tax=Trichonephila inaurata madagascariensis TaxID=2747483 RepID=A0A8X6XHB8_9ARAC|nr:hypothetical protein TNIN_140321 [Trichonephila inaurata madagascariensis]